MQDSWCNTMLGQGVLWPSVKAHAWPVQWLASSARPKCGQRDARVPQVGSAQSTSEATGDGYSFQEDDRNPTKKSRRSRRRTTVESLAYLSVYDKVPIGTDSHTRHWDSPMCIAARASLRRLRCSVGRHQADCVQGRQVWILQYRHSKIHQCGPEWHSWQVHWIKVLSDLIILNECAHA